MYGNRNPQHVNRVFVANDLKENSISPFPQSVSANFMTRGYCLASSGATRLEHKNKTSNEAALER